MTGKYSEQELIENTAIEVFKSLGYEFRDCYEEWTADKSFLGRNSKMDVVLVDRLRTALVRLNPDFKPDAINSAIEDIIKDRSILSPANANYEVYKLLRDGVKVKVRKEHSNEEIETVKVIDFGNPDNNDFFLASQLWISGDIYNRRADLIGFVNGIPLIFIELKALHKKLENAFRDNLTDYKDTIPQLFWYNAFIILSNGSHSRIGSITASLEHFNEWKRINSEGEAGIVSLDTIIKGTCDKAKFLDMLENFILYQNADGSRIKILAKNHQYLGVNRAIESFRDIENKERKLGVFWHTQGSGKSFSMIFFSQKILRKIPGNYTFLIVTDRIDLDKQIYKNFLSVGAVTEQEVHAENGEHLKQLLKEDHRNIFTIIHKFNDPKSYPVSSRKDIIVITDESHRTQYDTLAMNMRKALPNASFIAFTATPLIVGEEKTKETFGDYISTYTYKQSVADNATVPLFYENRIPEVELDKNILSDGLENILEEAELNDEQEAKLRREFSKEYHIITRDDRLNRIAEDIVKHFVDRGYQGKAMVVSIDKPTAVKMYDKVQEYWKKQVKALKEQRRNTTDKERKNELYYKIQYMRETDMAVVISSEQNEIKKFKELGLNIKKHRMRMVKEDLDTKFKDEDDKLRIVFVCAMWMTGFDVPCLSTIYLDKPMKNHTLMQTIARPNRVFGNKPNGLIIDYVGIFRNLQKALAIYNPGGKIDDYPIKPKHELLAELTEEMGMEIQVLKEQNIDLDEIKKSDKLHKIKLVTDAVDILITDDEVRKEYLNYANIIEKLYKAILPDPSAEEFKDNYAAMKAIAEKIRSLYSEIDITLVREQISGLLDDAIKTPDYVIKESGKKIDLSQIKLDAIRKRFAKRRKHIEAQTLRSMVEQKLAYMLKYNKTREALLEKFQKLVEEYNSGAINVEIFFNKLVEFASTLEEEDKRNIAENLSEEELAIFDLLYKSDLTKKEREEVKKVAKDLLATLKKEKLVLEWRKKQQARADVLLTIQSMLDTLPASYTKPIYEEKCDRIYQHVYDSYFGEGKSIYAA